LLLIGDILPALKAARKDLQESGLVSWWLELCAREAEFPLNQATALSLMADLWLSFDLEDEMANLITHTFKRVTKHPEQVSRIASAALLFRLVDYLGKKKDKSAP